VRLATVGWVRSYVRDPEHREILFDLDQVHAEEGKSRVFETLVKTRTNLLRLWAED
jgi:PKHD-type hydroxylase